MAVKVSFQGGPRHGTHNNLVNRDDYPATIKVTSLEARNSNMKPGRYVQSGKSPSRYLWQQD